jgi:nucleoside 2-deoxyribosyltransferase
VEGTLAVPQHEIIALKGVSLPWEDRPRCNVYLAAPDFDYVQRRPLECLADCLKYHNFTPRRPVLEHGQAPIHASPQKKQALCDADVRLMDECQMMIAVLLMDDPGTFIEIGMAVERGMPVIVYDPYEQAGNLMLTQLPHLVSHDIDEVISAVFRLAPQVI